jgi:hypothetical protein
MRSSFSTWIDDTCPVKREPAERALAHDVGNMVLGACRLSDLFTRRVSLMQQWANHCGAAINHQPANPVLGIPLSFHEQSPRQGQMT